LAIFRFLTARSVRAAEPRPRSFNSMGIRSGGPSQRNVCTCDCGRRRAKACPGVFVQREGRCSAVESGALVLFVVPACPRVPLLGTQRYGHQHCGPNSAPDQTATAHHTARCLSGCTEARAGCLQEAYRLQATGRANAGSTLRGRKVLPTSVPKNEDARTIDATAASHRESGVEGW